MAQIRFSLEVKGADGVRKRVGRLRAEVVIRRVFAEMVRGAILVEGRAKRRAPVDTGRLRASLTHSGVTHEEGAFFVRVGTNVAYAKFVEFGTGPRGAASALLETAKEAMKVLGYQHGPRGGAPAQPYLFPAFEESREDVKAMIAKGAREEFERT